MFVRESKYRDLKQERDRIERDYDTLVVKWNNLVTWINSHGGIAAIKQSVAKSRSAMFDQEDIKRLIHLCHPDKHDGKPVAEEMTRKLLALRT